jgi:hypothetical protein
MTDTPTLPDVTNMPELYLYGATMLQVQVWELALATLRFAIGVDPARAPKKLEGEVARSIKQSWHFYRKATATENFKSLQDAEYQDKDLLAEVETLIPIRTRLAHRYLRENLKAMKAAQDAGEPIVAAIFLELYGFTLQFKSSSERMTEAFQAMIRAHGKQEGEGQYTKLFEALGRAILEGKPLESDPAPDTA